MKKNAIIIMSALLSAAIIAALCIVNSRNDKLFNANVKALADIEQSWSMSKIKCFTQYKDDMNYNCLRCGDCKWIKGEGRTIGGICKNSIIKFD